MNDYLARDNWAVPMLITERVTGQPLSAESIHAVEIHLVKHGALYHPAMATLKTDGPAIQFVLNVAAGQAGRERIRTEAAHLERLYQNLNEHYLPEFFHLGQGLSRSGKTLPMFAAQWLTGFHEVHPTETGGPDHPWQVWDSDRPAWYMSEEETADFFRRALYILTYCFDPFTLSAIGQWHHGAGDFIVGRDRHKLDVRLITVRQYAPLLQLDPDETISLEILLDALTLFFLRTTLWMRIDRIDGVKDLVWADDRWVRPMWEGFIAGLDQMAAENGLPPELVEGVRQYLAAHSQASLHQLGQAMVRRLPADHPEGVLMAQHLEAHTRLLAGMVQEPFKQR